MESNNVRKLFLVDQFDRVYKQLQRPIQAVAKTESSINLSRTLQDEHLTEDEKVRRYIDELHRYLHLRDARPQQQQQQQQQLRPKHTVVRKKLPLSITTQRLPSPPVPSPLSPRKLRTTSTVADGDEEVFFANPAAVAKSSPVPPTRRKKKARFDSDDWSKYQRK